MILSSVQEIETVLFLNLLFVICNIFSHSFDNNETVTNWQNILNYATWFLLL